MIYNRLDVIQFNIIVILQDNIQLFSLVYLIRCSLTLRMHHPLPILVYWVNCRPHLERHVYRLYGMTQVVLDLQLSRIILSDLVEHFVINTCSKFECILSKKSTYYFYYSKNTFFGSHPLQNGTINYSENFAIMFDMSIKFH